MKLKTIALALTMGFAVPTLAYAAEDCCQPGKDGKPGACCEKKADGGKAACCDKHKGHGKDHGKDHGKAAPEKAPADDHAGHGGHTGHD
ncbi:hypothetical protein [Sphingomonas sp. KC8]|uniref:hypothetical protein n=1 Tax=Sphingomonas sp. KC8 TaxID=1030157 RepID=UPI0003060A51|nr:hypothetical protein [Sphingomonas sp. KC8]ARS29532.1 hypothetical protein KC8_19890 [Sphingomonas sp. KC8]